MDYAAFLHMFVTMGLRISPYVEQSYTMVREQPLHTYTTIFTKTERRDTEKSETSVARRGKEEGRRNMGCMQGKGGGASMRRYFKFGVRMGNSWVNNPQELMNPMMASICIRCPVMMRFQELPAMCSV
jgi:hypothetical protein